MEFDSETGFHENSIDSRYYMTISDGFLVLYSNLADAPKKGSPFASSPRGIVNPSTKMMHLMDEDKGCVYTVHAWGNTSLKKSKEQGQTKLKFKVQGAKYTNFFQCGSKGTNECDVHVALVHGQKRSHSLGGKWNFLLIAVGAVFLLAVALLAFKCFKRSGLKSLKSAKKMATSVMGKGSKGKKGLSSSAHDTSTKSSVKSSAKQSSSSGLKEVKIV